MAVGSYRFRVEAVPGTARIARVLIGIRLTRQPNVRSLFRQGPKDDHEKERFVISGSA
jgi:hypothetical protein